MLICKYCGKECKNENSLRNHERLCKENPNRQFTKFNDLEFQKNKKHSNQYIKAQEMGLPKPELKEESRKKISVKAKKRRHSDEVKNKLSNIAKQRNFGGVTQSRWIEYKGKKLGSSYELQVAQSLDENNIEWDTCKRFNYIDPLGKVRTYTPDFYLPEYNVYLDPKNDFLIQKINPALGFNDLEKIKRVEEQNNIRIIVLSKNELEWKSIKELLPVFP